MMKIEKATNLPVKPLQINYFLIGSRRKSLQGKCNVSNVLTFSFQVIGDSLCSHLKSVDVLRSLEFDQCIIKFIVVVPSAILIKRDFLAQTRNFEPNFLAFVFGDGKVQANVNEGKEEENEEGKDEQEWLKKHAHFGELELQLEIHDMFLGQLADALNGDDWAALNVQVGEVKTIRQSFGGIGSVKFAHVGALGQNDFECEIFH